jgi:hypothetical protein
MKQRSLDMVTLSATKRYLNLMEQKPDVVRFAPLKQIASYLGVTDTSLSRIENWFLIKKNIKIIAWTFCSCYYFSAT